MKASLRAAAAHLAQRIVEQKAAGACDWQTFARAVVRDLSPAQQYAIAHANEHVFQSLLANAMST
jgi:hypothetical protein